ncbi:MAG: immunity 49 family protein [Acidobacteria bacterium]|nr:immunity 49 family protein [Acidobacteriota bacterium]
MTWSDEISGVALDAAFWWIGVEGSPIEQVGSLSLEVSSKLRTLAILALLGKGSTDGFVHSCTRAARVRRMYLSRLTAAGIEHTHHRVSGRYEPLLDAIAAGDLPLVSDIEALSPGDFRPPHEYEDDYCYAQILFRLCRETVPEDEFPPLLARFEAFAADANPRLAVCQALVERSERGFDEAFDVFLTDVEVRIQKKIANGQLEDVYVLAQRHVSIEGLALLRLATMRGIRTEAEYLFCPSLARRPASYPCPTP